MMMRLMCILLISATTSFAAIGKNVDWAVFYGADNQPQVELYYSLNQADLEFVANENQYRSTFLTRLNVYQEGELVKELALKNASQVADTTRISEQNHVLDQLRFSVPAGDYECILTIQDLERNVAADSVNFDMTLFPKKDEVFFSDMQLAVSIQRANKAQLESPFYKNTLLVKPEPSRVYGEKQPMLFFYTEVYNLPAAVNGESYDISYWISDKNNEALAGVPMKTVPRQQSVESQVEYGYLNVGRLDAGVYNLNITVNQNDMVLAERQKEFYVFQKDQITAPADVDGFPSSDFAHMEPEQINKEFDYIYYIIDKPTRATYNQISDVNTKRKFLYEFWLRVIPKNPLASMQYRQEYLRRVDHANKEFSAFKKEGWRTDRGRVFILYGKPDEIDRYPNEPNMAPWQEWKYYNLQNGVRFIFADLDDWNDYQLIHSDLYGETQNRNFMDIIKRGNF